MRVNNEFFYKLVICLFPSLRIAEWARCRKACLRIIWLCYCVAITAGFYLGVGPASEKGSSDRLTSFIETALLIMSWLLFFKEMVLFIYKISVFLLLSAGIGLYLLFTCRCRKDPGDEGSSNSEASGQQFSFLAMLAMVINQKVHNDHYRRVKTHLRKRDEGQAEQCVVCQGRFERSFLEAEEVIELNCPMRHCFHKECLNDWAVTKMDCPVCGDDSVQLPSHDPTPEVHLAPEDLESPVLPAARVRRRPDLQIRVFRLTDRSAMSERVVDEMALRPESIRLAFDPPEQLSHRRPSRPDLSDPLDSSVDIEIQHHTSPSIPVL